MKWQHWHFVLAVYHVEPEGLIVHLLKCICLDSRSIDRCVDALAYDLLNLAKAQHIDPRM